MELRRSPVRAHHGAAAHRPEPPEERAEAAGVGEAVRRGQEAVPHHHRPAAGGALQPQVHAEAVERGEPVPRPDAQDAAEDERGVRDDPEGRGQRRDGAAAAAPALPRQLGGGVGRGWW